MSAELSIDEIWDLQKFEGLKTTWNELMQNSDVSHFYCTFEVALAWWRHRKASVHLGGNLERRPCAFIIRDHSQIIGIVPLVFSYDRVSVIRLRKASFSIGRYWQADFVFRHGRLEECLRYLVKYLLIKKKCYCFELEGIETGSSTVDALKAFAKESGFVLLTNVRSTGYYLPIVGTWEEFMKGKSTEFRWECRRYLNRLGKLGKVDVLRVGNATPLQEIIEKVMIVERGSWKNQWIMEDDTGGYLLEVLKLCHENGWLDLTFLLLNEVPISFYMNIRHNGKALAFHTCYNSSYAHYSPGFTGLYFVLKQFFEDRERPAEVDFGSGWDWIGRWTKTDRTRLRLRIYRQKRLLPLAMRLKQLQQRLNP